jgi:hypothetical protein
MCAQVQLPATLRVNRSHVFPSALEANDATCCMVPALFAAAMLSQDLSGLSLDERCQAAAAALCCTCLHPMLYSKPKGESSRSQDDWGKLYGPQGLED